ncbi:MULTISPECIES: pyridoxal-phosphate-dependent aminotransferase family protein [Alteromonas]|jgi:(S)-ureidoglycine-glyoxylate aminotransferase|uniref:Alanine--glyoxylate aminotransferase family protein n=2 Tax=Alteromonas stellipolaris TaxID=233316 RepID=A0AAW7Z6T1_9ALTE|nr:MULTISPECIES: alanine--glyoxylate aminotransferase family protein [Alteromonas]ALM91014.1 Serine-pyruvate aminotransferase [Alteromonas stellipolaris LMG 21856]AMJ74038.1 aminotransferase V [Alteromonas stellipolaris]AMJ94173.1 aminotransferase V [Alteromonas stellipolaris]MBZ2163111.1 alanine--glyoxylate aminotransferase family protein [Alteromonas stellipolaris]MDO6535601.1 alanine--glyoxylate aminotransferase family protein [Alteromonas stellipolaris]
MTGFAPLTPPPRLLMGPGPINCYPRVLSAMSTQLVGQYDPVMTGYMNETMALYRTLFNTENQQTMLIDGTSRAGIEAVLVSAIEPGDKVLVPIFGRFGHLLAEIAERADAEVHTIEVPWGEVFKPEQIEAAIKKVQPKLLAIVQGDTSTTMFQPLEDIGAICEANDVLFYCDATASVGGNPLEVDKWKLDAVSVGLQKCLGGPSGSAPITMSQKFVDVVRTRHHVEAGIRDAHHESARGPKIRSNYFDLGMIMDYWGDERLNHHTEAATMLYCARECAILHLEEGQQNVIARHKVAGDAMLAGVQALGLTPFGDLANKMSNVVGVVIPDGVHGEQVREDLLLRFNIEIGTSFGPLKGKIWRIGTMGYNARQDAVLHTLQSLETVLRKQGMSLPAGAGVDAALAVYSGAMNV